VRCGKIHVPAEIRETFYETAGCSLKKIRICSNGIAAPYR